MARKPEPPKRPSRVSIPDRAHPAAKVVFAEMQRQGVTYDELEHRSGVLRSTFKAWRTNNRPGLDTMEAALGALGWAYLPVPRTEHLPAEVQAGLEALAVQWERDNPLLCQLLATVCKVPILGSAPPTSENVVPMNRKARRKAKAENPNQFNLFEEVA